MSTDQIPTAPWGYVYIGKGQVWTSEDFAAHYPEIPQGRTLGGTRDIWWTRELNYWQGDKSYGFSRHNDNHYCVRIGSPAHDFVVANNPPPTVYDF